MTKPADRLRVNADQPPAKISYKVMHEGADALDEAERVIQQYVNDLEFGVSADSKPRRIEYARATLAKLRGEA